MITIRSNSEKLEYEKLVFSDTCINIKVDISKQPTHVIWEITDIANDIHILSLIINAYKQVDIYIPTLFMSYIPNARADRVFESGNAFPLEVTANFINSLGFEEVIVTDPHSDVAINLISNVSIKSQESAFFDTVPPHKRDDVILCSPDKGAVMKTYDVADRLNTDVIIASKVRDSSTGKILETSLLNPELVEGRSVIICDDICDGGGTFIPLAEKLKEAGAERVSLYVTHGIFSKGLSKFNGVIDELFVYNIVENYVSTYDIQSFNSKQKR